MKLFVFELWFVLHESYVNLLIHTLKLQQNFYEVNQIISPPLSLHISLTSWSHLTFSLSSCSLALILSHPSLSCFFSPSSLYYLFLSHSAFPFFSIAVNCLSHVLQVWLYPKSKRELLGKHLWLPPSLWLCSLPIFTTGPFEVMNEKWQYSSSDLRNRLGRAIYWQLEPLHKYWMQVLDCIQSSCFLFLWSKDLIRGV